MGLIAIGRRTFFYLKDSAISSCELDLCFHEPISDYVPFIQRPVSWSTEEIMNWFLSEGNVLKRIKEFTCYPNTILEGIVLGKSVLNGVLLSQLYRFNIRHVNRRDVE